MRKQNITLKAALELIRAKHPAAAPNSAFIDQLITLEKHLGAPSLLALILLLLRLLIMIMITDTTTTTATNNDSDH